MTAQEYNECVKLYADRVFRFIVKNTRNREDANDVVQNAYAKLWVKHEEVDFSKARSYLFTTAYNNMIDNIRKIKRIDFVESIPENSIKSSSEQFELKEVLQLALKELSEIQRSVIMLRDYEGYSYKEISELTQLTESQVKVYIFRGRKKLQEFIVSLGKAI